MEKKQFKTAIMAYELGVQHHPTDAYLYECLADACVTAGEKSKALKYYEQAIKLNPGSMGAKSKWENLKNKN